MLAEKKELTALLSREKTCLRGFANNKGADQPAPPRSLIIAVVTRLLQSIKSRLSTKKFQVSS